MRRRFHAVLIGLAASLSTIPLSAHADAVADFYKAQTVRITVGTGAGGGYDAYARLVARYLDKHLPGSPNVIVQNMPGASGIKAVNWLYSIAPRDGTNIATFNNSMPVLQVLDKTGNITYRAEELSWIAAMSKVVQVVAVWHTAGVRSLEDAKTKPVIMGATGADGTMAGYPALLNNVFGTQFKIVTGYKSGNPVNLAIERGELQGRGNFTWSSVVSTKPEWVAEKKIIPILQIGPKKEDALPHVPLLNDLARNDDERRIFNFISAVGAIARPFAGPPGIPAERLKALQTAFAEIARNEEFVAIAQKQEMDVDFSTGEETSKVVRELVETPDRIAQMANDLMDVRKANARVGYVEK